METKYFLAYKESSPKYQIISISLRALVLAVFDIELKQNESDHEFCFNMNNLQSDFIDAMNKKDYMKTKEILDKLESITFCKFMTAVEAKDRG